MPMSEETQPGLDPFGRPIPPWEAEQAREALAEARAAQGGSSDEMSEDEREREALRRVERDMLISEAEHRMFANQLEADNLGRMGSPASLGGCLRSMGGLTTLLYVLGFGSSPWRTVAVLAGAGVVALVLWFLSHELTAWIAGQMGSVAP